MTKPILVRDCMATRLTTLTPQMEILHAMHLLTRNAISGAPVLGPDGRLVGMLTERDCMGVVMSAAYHGEYAGTVGQYMATRIEVMAPDDNLMDAARRFHEQRYLRYPVLEGSELVGQISRSDVMRALGEYWPWQPR